MHTMKQLQGIQNRLDEQIRIAERVGNSTPAASLTELWLSHEFDLAIMRGRKGVA